MFENMYGEPTVGLQDPFAGMAPDEKAHNQQLDIQLGGNGSGQALLRRRGEITPGSPNFNRQEYDALYGNKEQGGTDYGWLGNAVNKGFRSFADDPTGALMGIDIPGMLENKLTFGLSDQMKNFTRINPMSAKNWISTADNPDGVNEAPDVTWQAPPPPPPGRLAPREAPVAPVAPVAPQPRLQAPPQRPTYGQEGGGWGWKTDGTSGGLFSTSKNGRDWTSAGEMGANGAPPGGGWQAQQGTNTAPGDWTKLPPPPGMK